MNDLVQALRKAIEARHEEALRALETINGYLKQTPLDCTGLNLDPERLALSPNHRSIRGQVLEQISDQARSVRDIERATGLTKRQVRGVISAPDLKDRMDRTIRSGTVHYQYVGDEDGEAENDGRDRETVAGRRPKRRTASNY